MGKIMFVNSNENKSKDNSLNTMISYKNYPEYLRYKDKPMQDIIDHIESKRQDTVDGQIETMLNN